MQLRLTPNGGMATGPIARLAKPAKGAHHFKLGGAEDTAASSLEGIYGLGRDLTAPAPARLVGLAHLSPALPWALGQQSGSRRTIGFDAAADALTSALRARGSDIELLYRSAEVHLDPWRQFKAPRVAGIPDADLARLTANSTVVPVSGEHSLALAFESDDLLTLAALELIWRSSLGQIATACQLCGCLFFPVVRNDEKYCRRTAPGEPIVDGRTCQAIGAQRFRSRPTDTPSAVYRKAHQRLLIRARRGYIERALVDAWRDQAKALLEQARADGWGAEQYAQELRLLDPERGE